MPLDRHDPPRRQRLRGRGHGIGGAHGSAVAASRAAPAARTPGTRWAGRGSAGRAGPRTPRGSASHIAKPAIVVQRPVVGDAAHDREARPAVRAVDERVAVAPVRRVEQLGEALVAGRRVRRDRRVRHAAARARRDREAALAGRRQLLQPDRARPPRAAAPRRAAGAGSARRRGRRPRPRRTTPRSSLRTKPREPELGASREHVRAGSRRPAPSPPPGPRAPAPAGGRRRRHAPLHQLAQDVVGARLRLLDARDVLGARSRPRGRRAPRRRCARRRSRPSRSCAAPRRRASASAAITFSELPLVDSASSASPAARVGDHLAREDRLDADVVGDRGEDRRVLGEVERRARRPAGQRRAEVRHHVHRVRGRAAVAERQQPAARREAVAQRPRRRRQHGRVARRASASRSAVVSSRLHQHGARARRPPPRRGRAPARPRKG